MIMYVTSTNRNVSGSLVKTGFPIRSLLALSVYCTLFLTDLVQRLTNIVIIGLVETMGRIQ